MGHKAVPGKEYPGVICDHCEAPIAIETPPEKIADEFQARCPKCKKTSTYRKAEVQRLLAVRKQ